MIYFKFGDSIQYLFRLNTFNPPVIVVVFIEG